MVLFESCVLPEQGQPIELKVQRLPGLWQRLAVIRGSLRQGRLVAACWLRSPTI